MACYDAFMVSIRGRLSALAVVLVLSGLGLSACTQPEPVGPKAGATQQSAAQGISDVPMPSGADQVVDDSLVLGSLDRWTGRLVLNTGLSPEKAFAFYRDRMPNFGWETLASIQSEVSVLSFARADRIATIQIEGRTFSFGGSRVSITMAPRQDLATSTDRSNDGVDVTPIE